MNKKNGHIEIIFLLFILIIMSIFIFSLYILHTQIATSIIPIKQDLFYIVQNSYLSLQESNLEYNQYIIDNALLKERVGSILEKNYSNCRLENISYDLNNNSVHVEVIASIKPVILDGYIGNLNLNIKDDVKLKMMEVSK